MMRWDPNIPKDCVLCREPLETRNHLFFTCPYSRSVWADLAKGFLKNEFTSEWTAIVSLLTKQSRDKLTTCIMRYGFQTVLYHLQSERNGRRHGNPPTTSASLIRIIDKSIRNRFSSIRSLGDTRYEAGLQEWFASRSPQP